MKIIELAKKIWKDPVGSGVIIAAILFGIASIPISFFWPIVLEWLRGTLKYLSQTWYIFTNLLLIVICTILCIKYIRLKKRKYKSIEWLKKIPYEKLLNQYKFLLWYPLNKTLISTPLRRATSDALAKIGFSKTITELTKRKILKFQINGSYEISEDAYDYLDNKMNDIAKKDLVAHKEYMMIKDQDYLSLLWTCLFG